MPTYLVTLAYDGTHFKGWQTQRTHGVITERTVQSEVERVLQKSLPLEGPVIGASRTDSGVHARNQAVSFTLKKQLSCSEVFKRLHALLPADIAPQSVTIKKSDFHARYSAKKKQYIYTINNSNIRPVINRNYVWWCRQALDIDAMKQAAGYMRGTHDFRLFGKKSHLKKTTVCTIHTITIKKIKDEIIIRVEGNRFLYNMVRNIVGLLVIIGSKRKKPSYVKKFLSPSGKEKIILKAPAHGLCLSNVYY